MKTTPQNIEKLRGTFKDGHASEEAQPVLEKLSSFFGVHFAILWAYADMFGCSGDSEMVVKDAVSGAFHEIPNEVSAFLYEEKNKVDIAAAKANFKPGKVVTRRNLKIGENLSHNYVYKTYRPLPQIA
jgi:hypothetical protein